MIGTLSFILMMSKLTAMEAFTAKKMQPADPLTEDRVIFKPEDIYRIKAMEALNAKKMHPADQLTEDRVILKPEDIYRIQAMEALTGKKMHPADPLTEDRVILKPEDIYNIKAMEALNAKKMHPADRDPDDKVLLKSDDAYRIKAMDALTAMKMQNPNALTEDRVLLKPEDVYRIKSFVHSMNHQNDGAIKDPGAYCRAFDNCYECVKSLWFPCGWCHDFGCTDSPAHLCPFAETKAENSNTTGAIKACPYAEHEGPILVPEGVSTNIKVKLYGPDPAIYVNEITCQIKIGKRVTELKGVIRDKVVHCYPVILQSYAKLYGDKDRGALTLKWGGAEPYSNQLPLILYNCEVLASNCENCAKIQSEYRCGWCYPVSKCMLEEECDHSRLKWIRDSWSCDKGRVNRGYRRFRRGNSRRC